jgi:hypothetical protein
MFLPKRIGPTSKDVPIQEYDAAWPENVTSTNYYVVSFQRVWSDVILLSTSARRKSVFSNEIVNVRL